MPLPVLLPLAIAAAGSFVKGATGLAQMIAARKMDKKNPFPMEDVNSLLVENAENAKNMARVGMPGQQYRNSVNNISKNQAGGIRALARSANPSAGLTSMVRAGNDAAISLDVADANMRTGNQRFAMGQNQVLAQEQNRVFNWNKREKFMQMLAKSEAMKGAGMRNLMGVADDAMRIGMLGMGDGANAASSPATNDPFKSYTNVSAAANNWMKTNSGKSAFPLSKVYNPVGAVNNNSIFRGVPYAMPKVAPLTYKMPWAK